LGDARKAIEFYEQALAIARKIGDPPGEGNALVPPVKSNRCKTGSEEGNLLPLAFLRKIR
jgi:hypothetical protein